MTLQRGWRDACWATRSWRWWGTASPRRGMEVRTCSETFGTKVSEAKVEGKEERRGGKKSIAYDRKEISTRVFRRIRSLENTSYERVSRGSRDTFLRERGNISSVKKKCMKYYVQEDISRQVDFWIRAKSFVHWFFIFEYMPWWRDRLRLFSLIFYLESIIFYY